MRRNDERASSDDRVLGVDGMHLLLQKPKSTQSCTNLLHNLWHKRNVSVDFVHIHCWVILLWLQRFNLIP